MYSDVSQTSALNFIPEAKLFTLFKTDSAASLVNFPITIHSHSFVLLGRFCPIALAFHPAKVTAQTVISSLISLVDDPCSVRP